MIEGLYTKENLWAEFALQKTKPKKIKWRGSLETKHII